MWYKNQVIQGLEDFTGEFYQMLKEELIRIFLKLFQKFCGGQKRLNSFYEARIVLTLKADKDTRKDNCRSISLMTTDTKTLNKTNKLNSTAY